MDGKGRCLDNVFVERLWRTVKFEYVYLWRPEAVPALASGLSSYFGYYNGGRTHQSLQDRTPAEVYDKGGRCGQGCRAFWQVWLRRPPRGGDKKDSAGMVGPAEPSTGWYAVVRAIPWLDARQQSQPLFRPAGRG